jgi:ferredoxin--NADP+ reductase
VIGTNKPDAAETVSCMLEDLRAGQTLAPEYPEPDKALAMIQARQPRYVSYDDWRHIDALEVARGEAEGRPRVKFTSVEEFMAALHRS